MADSDYGSDVEFEGDEAADALISSLDANPIASQNLELENLVEAYDARSICVAQVSRSSQGSASKIYWSTHERLSSRKSSSYRGSARPSVGSTVEYENSSVDWEAVESFARSPPGDATKSTSIAAREPSVEQHSEKDDARSPLERFRTAPKKPLSVTDMVSPAWCELQYWYALTKFGKKQRTPAMRQGSAVHRALEEQVHTIVPITVETKEDGWGLRIWNVIQGLRTLRVTGMTRELEIWGVIKGQVVNGIIDELSYTCTHPQLEAEVDAKNLKASGKKEVPTDQQTIKQFFSSQRSSGSSQLYPSLPASDRKLYLTDIKTRARHSLPTQAAMRPTMMQLMLYRSLFTSLAANDVPADTVFNRYGVDSSARFTDAFIDEVSSLDFSFAKDAGINDGDSAPLSTPTHAVQELQQHNNLMLLWQLMIQEFTKTVSSADSISDVLCAQFIHARDQVVLGSKCFAFDQAELDEYVQDEMKWWKGERPARGVDIEDAYKCRICEFAEECTWRREKIEEAVGRHRDRKARTSLP